MRMHALASQRRCNRSLQLALRRREEEAREPREGVVHRGKAVRTEQRRHVRVAPEVYEESVAGTQPDKRLGGGKGAGVEGAEQRAHLQTYAPSVSALKLQVYQTLSYQRMRP